VRKSHLLEYNCWVAPTYHPSYVNRSLDDKAEGPVIKLWFEKHLEAAVKLRNRPWNKIPDYANEVEIIMNSDNAFSTIRDVTKAKKPFAFDYETNKLKPDSDDAEIVCCSISTGDKTFAFPWVGEAISAMKELLKSDIPKIGYNTKFEDRWTRKEFGFPVENWVWDGMLSAHHLDNRREITSCKFQAFVRLGMDDWGYKIKPYLQSTGNDGLNTIHQLDSRDLLLYCGLDSLLEYKIAFLQRKEMKNG